MACVGKNFYIVEHEYALGPQAPYNKCTGFTAQYPNKIHHHYLHLHLHPSHPPSHLCFIFVSHCSVHCRISALHICIHLCIHSFVSPHSLCCIIMFHLSYHRIHTSHSQAHAQHASPSTTLHFVLSTWATHTLVHIRPTPCSHHSGTKCHPHAARVNRSIAVPRNVPRPPDTPCVSGFRPPPPTQLPPALVCPRLVYQCVLTAATHRAHREPRGT